MFYDEISSSPMVLYPVSITSASLVYNEYLFNILFLQVVAKIFDNLTLSDLLSVRSVCGIWKREADVRLLRSNKIRIKIRSSKNLKKFMNAFENADGIHFKYNYILEDIHIDNFATFFPCFGEAIANLNLHKCTWRASTLKGILFYMLPNLKKLEVTTDQIGSHRNEPLLPMSFCMHEKGTPKRLNLRELNIRGDYSTRTDFFYDLLKLSSSLEVIRLSKYYSGQDDLFGTWLTEIILSSGFPHLKCLELECTLIQSQIDSLLNKDYPLRRLCIDFTTTSIEHTLIEMLMDHFPLLESVEFGIDNASPSMIQVLTKKYQGYNCWLAIHPASGSKLVFPYHEYVLH